MGASHSHHGYLASRTESSIRSVFDFQGRPERRYGVTARGSALGVLAQKPAHYDALRHLDHMSASAVARGNSQSAEGPAVHDPLSL